MIATTKSVSYVHDEAINTIHNRASDCFGWPQLHVAMVVNYCVILKLFIACYPSSFSSSSFNASSFFRIPSLLFSPP